MNTRTTKNYLQLADRIYLRLINNPYCAYTAWNYSQDMASRFDDREFASTVLRRMLYSIAQNRVSGYCPSEH